MKIFCDLDGTLLDVAPRHYQVYTECVEEFGGHPLKFLEYWDLKRKKEKWFSLLQKSSLLPEIEANFLEHFIKKIEDPQYLNMDTLFDGAYDVVKTLSKNNELFLVSLRRNEKNLHQELKNLRIYDLFEKVLSGHSETDGYDKKIELISEIIDGNGGAIIGDTEADIVTGKQLGLTTIAVKSGIRDGTFLAALEPDYLLDNIIEVNTINL